MLDSLELALKTPHENIYEALDEAEFVYRLDLGGQGFRTLPQGFGKFRRLQELRLNLNELDSLSDELCAIPWLQELDLSENKLSSLPICLDNLHELRNLNLSHNFIFDFPKEICRLNNLEILYLDNNPMGELPEDFVNLHNLRELHLRHLRLVSLPKQLFALSQLEHLDFSDNEIAALPDGIEKLNKLRILEASFNRLREVPSNTGSLAQLEVLLLNGNAIKTLPESMINLTALHTLSLEGNDLTELPDWITKLSKLEYLNLGDNPWTDRLGYPSVQVHQLKNLKKLVLRYQNLRTDVVFMLKRLLPNTEIIYETDSLEIDTSHSADLRPDTTLQRRNKINMITLNAIVDTVNQSGNNSKTTQPISPRMAVPINGSANSSDSINSTVNSQRIDSTNQNILLTEKSRTAHQDSSAKSGNTLSGRASAQSQRVRTKQKRHKRILSPKSDTLTNPSIRRSKKTGLKIR
jgi:Leucine-rich repeat (LRR) protein